jgi:hypothetical protein
VRRAGGRRSAITIHDPSTQKQVQDRGRIVEVDQRWVKFFNQKGRLAQEGGGVGADFRGVPAERGPVRLDRFAPEISWPTGPRNSFQSADYCGGFDVGSLDDGEGGWVASWTGGRELELGMPAACPASADTGGRGKLLEALEERVSRVGRESL